MFIVLFSALSVCSHPVAMKMRVCRVSQVSYQVRHKDGATAEPRARGGQASSLGAVRFCTAQNGAPVAGPAAS